MASLSMNVAQTLELNPPVKTKKITFNTKKKIILKPDTT